MSKYFSYGFKDNKEVIYSDGQWYEVGEKDGWIPNISIYASKKYEDGRVELSNIEKCCKLLNKSCLDDYMSGSE